MMDRLAQIADEYETLEHQLADPEVLADPEQLRTASKRYNDLGPVVEKIRRFNTRLWYRAGEGRTPARDRTSPR